MTIYTGFLTRVTIWDDVALDVTDPDVRLAMLENPGDELGNNIVDFYGPPEVWNAGENQGSGGDFVMTGEVDTGVKIIAGTLFVDPDLFHGGVVTPGLVTITGTLFVDPDLFHGGEIIPEEQILTGTLFVDSDLFHGGEVTLGIITLIGTLFVDPDLFHGGVVTPGTVTITGTLFVDPDLFHGGVISLDAATPEEAIEAILDTTTDSYWMWPRDSATVFQDTPGTVAALDTDPVREVTNEFTGGLQDITEAVAPSDAARGVLSITGPDAHILVDQVDDNYIVTAPAGGWNGTLFYGMNDVTMSARATLPAGSSEFPILGQRSPGNEIFALIYTDGILSDADALIIENAIIEVGAGTRNPADQGVLSLISWFRNNEVITFMDLNHWDVSSINSLRHLFRSAINLTEVVVSSWDVSSVTNFQNMCELTSSLVTLDMAGWTTTSATNLARMFLNCFDLTPVDVGNFDVSNVTSIANMFQTCGSLTSLDISNWVFGTALTNGSVFVRSCAALTSINVGSAFNGAVNCTNYTDAFLACALDVTSVNAILVSIEAAGSSNGDLDISGGTSAAPTGAGLTALNALEARGWTVATNATSEDRINSVLDTTTDSYWMWPRDAATVFQDTPGTVAALDTDPVRTALNEFTGGLQDITEAVAPSDAARGQLNISGPDAHILVDLVDDEYDVTIPAGGWNGTLIYGFNDVTVSARAIFPVGIVSVPVNNVTGTFGAELFSVIYTDGVLSDADSLIIENAIIEVGAGTRNPADQGITDYDSWFRSNNVIISMDLEHWDTALVTGMARMFREAVTIDELLVSSWDTGNVITFADFMRSTSSIATFDPSSWNVTNATILSNFVFNTSMVSLDISGWNLSSLADGSGMFRFNTLLTSINVGSAFNSSPCIDYDVAFSDCALDVASVNSILVSIEAAGTSNGTLGISGGTSAAPTGAGATAVTDLQGRSWTVTTN